MGSERIGWRERRRQRRIENAQDALDVTEAAAVPVKEKAT
jgi:hypothetical protein